MALGNTNWYIWYVFGGYLFYMSTPIQMINDSIVGFSNFSFMRTSTVDNEAFFMFVIVDFYVSLHRLAAYAEYYAEYYRIILVDYILI